jgi:hypothetical protein
MEALLQHALGLAPTAPYVDGRFRPLGVRAAASRGPSMTTMPVATKLVTWRTPAVIVLCGCLISMMSFGPRATLGLFLSPQSQANGWERDVFGLALAIQNILWGLGQPFAGMLADRFGVVRVLCGGGVLYALGLALMALCDDAAAARCLGRRPHRLRPRRLLLRDRDIGVRQAPARALALARLRRRHAGRLLRQFLYAPLTVSLMDASGWQTRSSRSRWSCCWCCRSRSRSRPRGRQGRRSARAAIAVAGAVGGVRASLLCAAGARLLHLRLPAGLHHRPHAGLPGRSRLSADVGGWTIAVIGLFNIVGSLMSGWLGNYVPKLYILSGSISARLGRCWAFISYPVTPLVRRSCSAP